MVEIKNALIGIIDEDFISKVSIEAYFSKLNQFRSVPILADSPTITPSTHIKSDLIIGQATNFYTKRLKAQHIDACYIYADLCIDRDVFLAYNPRETGRQFSLIWIKANGVPLATFEEIHCVQNLWMHYI